MKSCNRGDSHHHFKNTFSVRFEFHVNATNLKILIIELSIVSIILPFSCNFLEIVRTRAINNALICLLYGWFLIVIDIVTAVFNIINLNR